MTIHTYSSSYLPAPLSRWHVHSRVVVFHNLHRGQRDTMLCPLLVNFSTLYFLFHCPSPGLFIYPPCHPSPPSSSSTAAAASRAPSRSIPACYHHHILTCTPGAISDSSHRSNSDYVPIYCETVFWSRLTYSSIVKKPAASLAAAYEVYFHVPSVFLCRSCPVRRLVTWV